MRKWLAQLKRGLDNQYARLDFVRREIARLPEGTKILDAGAGNQRYRPYCGHLNYFAQDFAEFTIDDQVGLLPTSREPYEYGPLDYVGDIWSINAPEESFGAILCTEVLEHVPYPIESIRELSRLLKPGGTLILTVPSNCLRHMDPYFFTSGFSDRWIQRILAEASLEVCSLEVVGDYYKWMEVEIARTAKRNSLAAKAILFPSFLYFHAKRSDKASRQTLCMGYHVVAKKAHNPVEYPELRSN